MILLFYCFAEIVGSWRVCGWEVEGREVEGREVEGRGRGEGFDQGGK